MKYFQSNNIELLNKMCKTSYFGDGCDRTKLDNFSYIDFYFSHPQTNLKKSYSLKPCPGTGLND